MSKLIDNIPTFSDERGNLSAVENLLGFDIKRFFYIYGVPKDIKRGGHGHFKTKMGLLCIQGSCIVNVSKGGVEEEYLLDSPDKLLLLETMEWHDMENFSNDSILLVLASERYNADDYFEDKK